MKIKFLPGVLEYFNDLTTLLYEKDYFGFKENALRYVNDLLEEINAELPLKLKKPAPPYFNKYGKNMQYASFRKNKGTQWYVFFNTYRKDGEIIYLIRYISNNHVIAHFL